MWKELSYNEKEEYRRMILAFAGLTEMFAQKADTDEHNVIPSPIINSKYQESVFQRVFSAVAEDIGNTSYDVSLRRDDKGVEKKYIVGIKTFGINSGLQKIAQFKAKHDEWSNIINKMKDNAQGLEKKEAINTVNHDLYLELAQKVSILRNDRILSAKAKLKGFKLYGQDEFVESVYHVLMPSKKGDSPMIYVGETSYNLVDVDNITVIGCTGVKNPTNFDFTDGKHTYRYTSADSQLLMNFQNKDIVLDKWDVVYAEDAYALFSKIGEEIDKIANKNFVSGKDAVILESYSWLIAPKGEVEKYSGFNNFYSVSSKLGKDQREKRIQKLITSYTDKINMDVLLSVADHLSAFLMIKANTPKERDEKNAFRKQIVEFVKQIGNEEYIKEVNKLLYRPKNEIYIPIPNAKEFHTKHPHFFGKNIGTFKPDGKTLALDKENCSFNLVFEPSGNKIRSFITQDNGKAIASLEKQSYLGEWVLREIFRLAEFEPLTMKRLNELGINGVRIYKTNMDNDVHVQFIWIDKDNLPDDYVK